MKKDKEYPDCVECIHFEQSPVDYIGYGECNKKHCFVKSHWPELMNCKYFHKRR